MFRRRDLWQFGSSISFGFGRHAIVYRQPRRAIHRFGDVCFSWEPFIQQDRRTPSGFGTTVAAIRQLICGGKTIQSIEGFDSGSE